MIKIEFVPPNRICKFRDGRNKLQKWLSHRDMEKELRKRLKKARYTEIEFVDYDFEKWRSVAEKAKEKAIAEFEGNNGNEPVEEQGQPEGERNGARPKNGGFKFSGSIWQPLRPYLLELFHGKCAYCEVKVEHGSSTQVEHYRPKSGDCIDGKHGYYWLAYDETNYVPACAKCNGKKSSKFPLLQGGVRARSSADSLAGELPALLNPSLEGPEKDLEFEPKIDNEKPGGFVKPLTKRGEKTIQLLGWDQRLHLVEQRRRKQEQLIKDVGASFVSGQSEKVIRKIKKVLTKGLRECSAAQLAQLNAMPQYMKKLLQ